MNLQDELNRTVAKKVIQKMNVDKICAALIPQLEKKVSAAILASIKNVDWAEYLCDWMSDKNVNQVVAHRIAEAFKRK